MIAGVLGVAIGWRTGKRGKTAAARAVKPAESVHVDLATSLDDLKVPPGNRLHALKGDRKGRHAIAINDQWRIW